MLRLLNSVLCGPSRLALFKTVLLCWNRAHRHPAEATKAFASLPNQVFPLLFSFMGAQVAPNILDGEVYQEHLMENTPFDPQLADQFRRWCVPVEGSRFAIHRNPKALEDYAQKNPCCPDAKPCPNLFIAADKVTGDHSRCVRYFLRHGFDPDTPYQIVGNDKRTYTMTAAAVNPNPFARKIVIMLLQAGATKIQPFKTDVPN